MFSIIAQKTVHVEKLINQIDSSKQKNQPKPQKNSKPQDTKTKTSIHEMKCTQAARRARHILMDWSAPPYSSMEQDE